MDLGTSENLLPYNHVFCWDVFGFSYWDLHLCSGGIERRWYSEDDVVCVELSFKVCSKVYCVFDSRFGWLRDVRL